MDWIDWSWITSSPSALLMVVLKAFLIYATLLLFTRTAGLRSFAKMSSFDFAITVAMGTVLASTLLTENPPLLQGMAGLVALFTLQMVVSWLRRKTAAVPALVDNRPLLLMSGSEVIQANLDKCRVTESDLNSKLRQAGVLHRRDVVAVVMETTGDVSVLKASDTDRGVDPALFDDVRDAHLIEGRSRKSDEGRFSEG